mgnify:CR=1 FL=1
MILVKLQTDILISSNGFIRILKDLKIEMILINVLLIPILPEKLLMKLLNN